MAKLLIMALLAVVLSMAHASLKQPCPSQMNDLSSKESPWLNFNHYRGFNGQLRKNVYIKTYSKKVKASSLKNCFQKCVDSRYAVGGDTWSNGDPNPYPDGPGKCNTFSYEIATKNCFVSELAAQDGQDETFDPSYQLWCPFKGFTAGVVIDENE